MKFFTKVLYSLYPKIVFAQIVYLLSMGILIWYCITQNTKYFHLIRDWEMLIFFSLALIFTLLFVPKILKIVFFKPNRNSQSSAKSGLIMFLFFSMCFQFIFLRNLVVSNFGKIEEVSNYTQIIEKPESSFFVFHEDNDLSKIQVAYYYTTYLTGKSKKTFNIDIFATKQIGKDGENAVIFCKKYATEYPGRKSESEAKELVEVDLKNAQLSFRNLNIHAGDTLFRVYQKSNIENYTLSFQLINSSSQLKYRFIEKSDDSFGHFTRKTWYIFIGFELFANLTIVLFLAKGIRYKD